MQTPHQKYEALGKAMGLPDGMDLYLKREDLHHYGSHKGRSIPVMIDHYYTLGDRRFAISSSGNAALAAALYIAELKDAELDIFVGSHVAPHKLEKLKKLASENSQIRVLIKERPLQALTQVAQEGVRSLRQSLDEQALAGYISLASEIAEIPNVGSVFIGTSSGTTAQALASYFLKKKLPIQVHIVQTSACHPMTDDFEVCEAEEEHSLADAIVDKTAYRKPVLIPFVEKTGGHGWCATNQKIENALMLAEKYGQITISPNSALSLAGAIDAIYSGWDMEGNVVCMICGD